MIIDLAPGGNVVFPLIVKDLNGLDTIVSPAARLVTIPVLEHNDGEQGPREYMWWCEPLVIFHGGSALTCAIAPKPPGTVPLVAALIARRTVNASG